MEICAGSASITEPAINEAVERLILNFQAESLRSNRLEIRLRGPRYSIRNGQLNSKVRLRPAKSMRCHETVEQASEP